MYIDRKDYNIGKGITREEQENLKIGDKLYRIADIGIIEETIKEFDKYNQLVFESGHKKQNIGIKSKAYFLTREEAEKELDLRQKTIQKKKLLREYEEKLNKELGISEFIVKV